MPSIDRFFEMHDTPLLAVRANDDKKCGAERVVRPQGGGVWLTASSSAHRSSDAAAHDPNDEYCMPPPITQPHVQNPLNHPLEPGSDHDAQDH